MTNNTSAITTSNYEGLVATSIAALVSTVPANIGFIILGTLTALSNILEFATIASDLKLRTRCYALIANMSVASMIYAVSYIVIGIKRLIRLSLGIDEVKTKRACAGEMFTAYFGQAATVFLPLATALDRVVATVAPVKYKHMSSAYAIVMATSAWLLATLDSGFIFYGSDQTNLVTNCNMVSTSDLLYQIQNAAEMTVSASVTLCYLGVVLTLRRQMSQVTKSKSENLAAAKMKVQMKVAKTLGIDSTVHLITQVITRVGLTVLSPLSPTVRFAYAPFIRLILIGGCGLSLIIFLTINQEFKNAFIRTFRLGRFMKVTPGEITNMKSFTKAASTAVIHA